MTVSGIKDEGTKALSETLKVNTTLATLNLESEEERRKKEEKRKNEKQTI